MPAFPIYLADAFVHFDEATDYELRGNPAAVVLLSPEDDFCRDDKWRQRVAEEMNQSETAFVVPRVDGDFNLRWFTPEVEVDLCGHATLAAAHVLWESRALSTGKTARFHTRSGLLTATRNGGRIELDFPAQPVLPVTPPDDLLEVLGVPIGESGATFRAADDWLVVVPLPLIRELKPDFGSLKEISRTADIRGVIVTAASGLDLSLDGVHFVSRFFAPGVGIDEDPVTGSAHTKLAPFWGERLGMTEMVGCQVSRRGGLVWVRLRENRVLLGGKARTTLQGTLLI